MTLMTEAGEGVIKTDGMGRMRTSAARRESLLEEFDRSGMSAPKFAAFVGLKYQTLATWLQKRRRQGAGPVKASMESASAPASPDTVKWLEAVVAWEGQVFSRVGCHRVDKWSHRLRVAFRSKYIFSYLGGALPVAPVFGGVLFNRA